MKKIIAIIVGLMFALWVGQGLMLDANDPLYANQTALTTIKINQAWTYNTGGSGVSGKVAVIGSGAGFNSTTIPDLPLNVVVTSDAPDPFDDNFSSLGITTHTASIIGSTGNNATDMAGVMWQSDLRVYKVYREGDHLGQITDLDVAEAINDAVSWGAQVIQIDPTFVAAMPLTLIAVNAALFADRIVVTGVASFGSGVGYIPANAGPELLVVSSGDVFGNPLGYDGEGPQMDLEAPGNGVLARASAFCCTTFSQGGTPASFVTGVAGLLREMLVGEWNTRRALLASATDISPAGFDNSTGYGLLNADCAMAKAGDMNNNNNVDNTDALAIIALFGQPGGDQKENVNGDLGIDLKDALIDLSLFGSNCT